MTAASGTDHRVPGVAHSGSCRLHHAFSISVLVRRLRYAGRDSEAAAQSKGMAAIPRGADVVLVFAVSVDVLPPLVMEGVFWGV
jgi:hypothetical protein